MFSIFFQKPFNPPPVKNWLFKEFLTKAISSLVTSGLENMET